MMNKLMLSCRAATALMEKKHRKEISFTEKIQLSMHLALCVACRRYQQQSRLLEKWFKDKEKTLDDILPEGRAEKLEEKIIRRLEKGS